MEVLAGEKTLSAIAAEYSVHPNLLTKWRAEVVKKMPTLFEDATRKAVREKKAQEELTQSLYAQIVELTTRLAWSRCK
ncbi:hypothetical protein AGMMS49992_03120 [Clostridia bacterium]|nr:hypothetical protein AGMMS49992_03120 [Clostridia bacterium]